MKILVMSNDRLGKRMAGPAVRALEISKFLRSHTKHSISLVGPGEDVDLPEGLGRFFPSSFVGVRKLIKSHDVVIAPSFKLTQLLCLYWSKKTVILDGYDPVPLEILEQHADSPTKQKVFMQFFHTQVLNLTLKRADLVLCASERQRAWYIGILCALQRIDPLTYQNDPCLEKLIQVVPFGLLTESPVHQHQVLKGVIPGIKEDDFLVLWGGGIWNWFDPLTIIQAVHVIAPRFPKLKLFFLGIQHPNPAVPYMKRCSEAIELAKSLGIENKSVFFNEGWIPFAERQNYLLESDIGVSLHTKHLESEFSFRTRVLDYLWAGLPLLLTEGDVWSELARTHNLGYVVAPGDVEMVADALTQLMTQPQMMLEMKSRVLGIAEEYRWETTLSPISQYLSGPIHNGQQFSWLKKFGNSIKLLWVAMISLFHWNDFKV